MSSTMNPKTIHLSPEEIKIPLEAEAKSTITPGQLIERCGARAVRRHTTPGGLAQLSFARENAQVGRTIDDDYQPASVTGEVQGDLVHYFVGRNGYRVYALLAAGENATDHDFLASDGGGNLRVARANDAIVAQTYQAVDNSLGAEPVRIKVELMICCQGYSIT